MDVDLITQSQRFMCDEAEAATTTDTDLHLKKEVCAFRRQTTYKQHTRLLKRCF